MEDVCFHLGSFSIPILMAKPGGALRRYLHKPSLLLRLLLLLPVRLLEEK